MALHLEENNGVWKLGQSCNGFLERCLLYVHKHILNAQENVLSVWVIPASLLS